VAESGPGTGGVVAGVIADPVRSHDVLDEAIGTASAGLKAARTTGAAP
jgi:hypothetical protein